MRGADRDEDDLEALYEKAFPAIVRLAVTRFAIPHEYADDVVYDILMSSLSRPRHIDLRSWIFGNLTHARDRYRGSGFGAAPAVEPEGGESDRPSWDEGSITSASARA